ncbi:MAG: FHA domain-containing protein [Planctomycetota bacterium]|jgi:hypothetical protein
MALPINLITFVNDHGGQSKEVFFKQFENPFLFLDMASSAKGEKAYDTNHGKKVANGPTVADEKAEAMKSAYGIALLAKSGDNSFIRMITVGRTMNNDIVVPHPSISKFHAYFRRDPETGIVSLSDAGSSYGTVMNGKRLYKGREIPIESGAEILFADSVRGTFLSVDDFFKSMQQSFQNILEKR